MKKLSKGREDRAKFVESQISQQIAAQIRAMRLRNKLSQPELAEKIGTSQNQIYRLEKPKTAKPKLLTLKRLAEAFDVGLVVRFVPFSQFTAWLSGTPYLDRGLSTSALYVPGFDAEIDSLAATQDRGLPKAAEYSEKAPHIDKQYLLGWNVISMEEAARKLTDKKASLGQPYTGELAASGETKIRNVAGGSR